MNSRHACARLNLLLFALVLPLFEAPNAAAQSGAELLQAFEETLVGVIDQVEPSVVAISRSPAVDNRAKQAAQRRQLLQRQFQPGELRALEALEFNGPAFGGFGDLRGSAPATTASNHVTGAGVVIDKAGLVLTQYLVVKPGDAHQVTLASGETLPAEIVGADPRSGLAVVKVKAGVLKPIEMGKAEGLRKGNLVIAVGNPYSIKSDGQATVSYGMVANLARKAPEGEPLNRIDDSSAAPSRANATLHHYGTLIQTDARLGWNASGGALVNLEGKLVGLTTSVAAIAGHEKPAGYAIPINQTMRRVIDALKQGREVEYGLLGVRFLQRDEFDPLAALNGIRVTEVYPGSAAFSAGLRSGDVIIEINEVATSTPEKLQLAVGSLSPGASRKLVYVRNGARRETRVTLSKIYVPGEKVITNRPPAWQGIHVDYATALEDSRLVDASKPQAQLIDSEGCVAVVEVEEGSTAWNNGVRPGMFVSHVANRRVSTPEEFRQAVGDANGDVNRLRFTPGNTPEPAKPVAGERG